MRRTLIAAGFILALARNALGAPSSIPAAEFADFAFRQHPGALLPLDTPLHGRDGTLTLAKFFGGGPVVLDFEYDRCTTLCGVMLDQVLAALDAQSLVAGRDYRLIALDIDPTATPQEAEAFARRHGADRPGIAMLTGDQASIARVAEAVGFPYERDAATGQYAHPAGIIVATPAGRISRYWLGLAWRPRDLQLSLIDAAGESIARPAETLLLFCYSYDPATGQYDFAIARLVEIIAIASLIALGGLVWHAAHGDG